MSEINDHNNNDEVAIYISHQTKCDTSDLRR